MLGRARDLEVRAEHCARALADLGLESLHGALVAPLVRAHAGAHEYLLAWHRRVGRVVLDDRLDAWSTAPPLTTRAGKPDLRDRRHP